MWNMEAGKWIKYIYSMYCTLFSSYEKAQCQGKIMRNIQYSTIRFSIQLIYLLYNIFFWCPLSTETAIFADHFVILFAQKWGNLYCCKSEMMYGTVFSLTFVSQTFSVRNSERSVNKIKVLTTRTLRNSGKGPHHHKKILKTVFAVLTTSWLQTCGT